MGFLDKLPFFKKKDDFGDLNLGDKTPGLGPDFGAPDLSMNSQDPFVSKDAPSSPDPLGLTPPSAQPSFQQQPPQFQQPAQPQFQQQQPAQQQFSATDKDLEIISSKLDALRAGIESINQRLANIEQMARGEQEKRKYRY